jgi:hypothetical protein
VNPLPATHAYPPLHLELKKLSNTVQYLRHQKSQPPKITARSILRYSNPASPNMAANSELRNPTRTGHIPIIKEAAVNALKSMKKGPKGKQTITQTKSIVSSNDEDSIDEVSICPKYTSQY